MWWLLACVHGTAPTHAPPRGDLEGRVREALAAPEPTALTPLRATVARIGPYQVVPGRDVYSPEPVAPFDVVVLADEGEVVRVLHAGSGLRYVLGVRRDDLAERPVEATRLTPEAAAIDSNPAFRGTPGAPDGWVELDGGTAAEVVAEAQGSVRLVYARDGLAVDGWAPRVALGRVWRATTRVRPDGPALLLRHAGDPEHPERLDIRDAPDGTVIATVAANASPALVELGSGGGRVRAWVRVPGVEVVGWMDAAATIRRDQSGHGTGGGWFGTPSGVAAAELAAGVWLGRDGWTFGRVVEDVVVPIVADDDRGLRVSFPSPWGTLEADATCVRRSTPRGDRALVRCE